MEQKIREGIHITDSEKADIKRAVADFIKQHPVRSQTRQFSLGFSILAVAIVAIVLALVLL